MNCRACGFLLEGDDKFCPKCGAKFSDGNINYEEKVESAFEEIKQLVILFFKNPAALADKATKSSHNTGIILAIMTLILVAITSMLWSVKSGSIFNIFNNTIGLLGAVGTQVFSYAVITGIMYMVLKDKNKDLFDVFNIVTIAYLPLVILRFLGQLVQIISLVSIISIGSAFITAGMAAFAIMMYKILVDNNLLDNRKAFFITILIAFLA